MSRKLLLNVLIYGFAPQISRVLSIVVLPFTTPFLTSFDYGVFGIALAVTSALSVFSNFGFNYILMVYFYKSPNHFKWMWRQIYGFLKIWMIIFAFIQSLFLYLFLPKDTNEQFLFIAILFALPFLFFSGASFIGTNFYRLSEKSLPIGIRTVIVGLVSVGVSFFLIRYFKLGYFGWFISLSISDILANILYYFPMHFKYKLTPIFNFKIKTIWIVLKKSFPLIPHYYSIYLLDVSDKLVMKVLQVPTSKIGSYNVIANFGSYFSAFHMAVGQAIGPNIFKLLKDKKHNESNKLIKYYMLISLILTITFSIWCKQILSFLIRNDELLSYYSWTVLIVMAYNYRPYYVIVNQYLTFNEQVNYLPYFTFVPGVINLLLNFLLIPIYGIKTAVFTTFFCYLLMGFMAFFIPKIRKSFVTNYFPIMVLIFILTTTFYCYQIVDTNFLIKIISNIFLVSFAYLLLSFKQKNVNV